MLLSTQRERRITRETVCAFLSAQTFPSKKGELVECVPQRYRASHTVCGVYDETMRTLLYEELARYILI